MVDEPQRQRRPTSNDVAARAGVSQSVVSYVLTGARPVSAETRQRVEQAMADLGFRPSRTAQNLRSSRSGQIAVAVPYIANPVYGSMVEAVQATLAEAGYITVIVSMLDVPSQTDAYFELIADSGIDGIILVPFLDHVPRLTEMRDSGLPIVLVDRRVPLPDGPEVDAVLVDNARGTRDAVSHLLSRGHRRVGLVAPSDPAYGDSRVSGYRAAHADGGLAVDERIIARGEGSFAGGVELTRGLLAGHPDITALVVTANMQTLGAFEALRADGSRRVEVVGFDSDDRMISLPSGVATVRYPGIEVGRASARMLLRRLAQPGLPPQTETLAAPLVLPDQHVS